jgi:hypothetical protein
MQQPLSFWRFSLSGRKLVVNPALDMLETTHLRYLFVDIIHDRPSKQYLTFDNIIVKGIFETCEFLCI